MLESDTFDLILPFFACCSQSCGLALDSMFQDEDDAGESDGSGTDQDDDGESRCVSI